MSLADSRAASLPFAKFISVRRFQSLDGWRAFAILAVIWHHTVANSFSSPIAYEGRHGVTLFFVISGFLIVTLLLRSQQSAEGFSLWRFWGRRALRILPIYYAVLAVYIVLVRLTDHTASGADFFRNLPYFATFMTNWFVHDSDRTIFFFSWSLSAEEQFYLIWPLVEVLVARPSHKLILLGLVVAASQIARAHYNSDDMQPLGIRMLCNVPLGIMLGTGLAHLLNNQTGFRLAYRIVGQPGSAFGCLGFAVATAIVSPQMGFAGELLVAVALLLLVAATVRREDNDLAGLLRWQPIAWVGTVSYGMYMLHMLAVNVIRRGGGALHFEPPLLVFIGGGALACVLASLSFLYFERRFLFLKDRLFHN